MTEASREVYVISDLHVGGRYAQEGDADGRGFRLCTRRGMEALTRFVRELSERHVSGGDVELVINGDFVDFLAEERPGDSPFVPFRATEAEVLDAFERIVARDRPFFAGLASLLGVGARLTVLLGNHDVELCFPSVRRRLAEVLGADPPARFHFLYDGEAYVVGDALIEHGNRYDGYNVIDHDALRRMRSLHSRRQPIGPELTFQPPPGSRLVASIMNPIKERYPFVDLLKPETKAVVPILLALEPGYRRHALELLGLSIEAARHAPVAPGMPAYGGDIASASDVTAFGGDLAGPSMAADDLGAALADVMSPDAARRFAEGIEGASSSGDIASTGVSEAHGLLRLFASRSSGALEPRLPALLEALRAVERDRSFDPAVETVPAYLEAARSAASRGFRYVLFGHTHLAKQVDLGGGCAYLNTGTWADLIRFPAPILDRANPRALDDLRSFVDDLVARRFAQWIHFRPTFVRLVVREGRVAEAALLSFEGGGS